MVSSRWLDQYNGSDQLQRPAGTASHYAHCPRKDSRIKKQNKNILLCPTDAVVNTRGNMLLSAVSSSWMVVTRIFNTVLAYGYSNSARILLRESGESMMTTGRRGGKRNKLPETWMSIHYHAIPLQWHPTPDMYSLPLHNTPKSIPIMSTEPRRGSSFAPQSMIPSSHPVYIYTYI